MAGRQENIGNNFTLYDVSEYVLKQPDDPKTAEFMDRDANSLALIRQALARIPNKPAGSERPRMTLILRDGNTRKIINEKLLIKTLKKLPVELGVYRFGTISFSDQVAIIDQTDILMAMHGAALTHVLFMRPNSFVIELFPYGFRKTVFDNISRLMGLKYMFWQNTHQNNTIFDWDYVENHRFTQVPKENIVGHAIDWYNMDSKNYWRNQDTIVDIPELLNVWISAFDSSIEEYLIYQPWGLFTEQLESFRVACAMGRYLNRRLVLPLMGYQPQTTINDDNHKSFRLTKFNWKPMQYYMNMHDMSQLSCRWITYENFYNLNQNQTINKIRLLPESATATPAEGQLLRYYHDMLYLPLPTILRESLAFPRYDASGLRRRYSNRKVPTLAFGSLPRTFFNFDAPALPDESKTSSTKRNVKEPLPPQSPAIQDSLSISSSKQNNANSVGPHHPSLSPSSSSSSKNSIAPPLPPAVKPQITFGSTMEALLPSSFNPLKETLHDNILKLMTFREDLVAQAKSIVQQHIKGSPFVAMHIRRGNAAAKCDLMAQRFEPTWLTQKPAFKSSTKNPDAKECHQNTKYIDWKLKKALRTLTDMQSSSSENNSQDSKLRKKKLKKAKVYISTDDHALRNSRREFADVGKQAGLDTPLFLSDVMKQELLHQVLGNTKTDTLFDFTNLPEYDAIEIAIIEILICIEADFFIGNKYSSFSREIVAQREYRKKPSLFF